MPFRWIKLHYLLLYGLIGAFLPYSPLYLSEQGFTDWQIGWVLGAYGLTILIMPTLTTYLADRGVANRWLIGIGHALAAIALALACLADQFLPILVLFMLFSIGCTPLISLLDGLTFASLEAQAKAGASPPPYHRLRIWGSVGFVIPSLALYALLRFTPATSRAALVTAAVYGALGTLTCLGLPAVCSRQRQRSYDLPTIQAWHALCRPPLSVMVGALFILFLAMNVHGTFYSLYLRELDIGAEWVGLIVNIGVLAELPWILGAGWALQAFGLRNVLLLGGGCLALRLTLLAVVPSIPVAVITQLLHGPSVLCLFIVPPMYLNAQAAPEYRNSIQGLYVALCLGIARLVGNATGGHAAGWGLSRAFALGAVFGIVATVWLAIGFHDRRTSLQPQGDDSGSLTEET